MMPWIYVKEEKRKAERPELLAQTENLLILSAELGWEDRYKSTT